MKTPRIALPEIGQDVRNYTRALYAAGMEPIVISVESAQIRCGFQQEYLDYSQFRIDAYDGLLLPGGGDIAPSYYGQKDEGCCTYMMRELDKLQLAVLDTFIQSKKPVLGICRGLQVINVYFDGSLIQHLSTWQRHSRPDGETKDRQHLCRAGKGSWLAGIYGTEFSSNSSHHQAVDKAGEGIVIDSRCLEDGVVEALHHKELPVFGVQWHPERMCLQHERPDTVNGLPVFDFFCRVCGGEGKRSEAPDHSWITDHAMGL